MTNEIKKTKNYDQFKRIIGNRPINIAHVNDLVKANSHINLLWQFPATVTKDGYLWDGQHRREASRNMNDWFYYTISTETLSDLIVAKTNTLQMKWSTNDFVHFYAERGNEQYIFLEELCKEYGIQRASLFIDLFFGRPANTRLKNGTLVIYSTPEEKQLFIDMVDGFLLLATSIDRDVFFHSRFIRALRVVFQQVTAEDLKIAIDKFPTRLVFVNKEKDYLRQMEDMLNRGKSEKSYTRFF